MTTLTQKTHTTGTIRGVNQLCADCGEILVTAPHDRFYEEGLKLGVIIGHASGSIGRYVVTQERSTTPKGCTE